MTRPRCLLPVVVFAAAALAPAQAAVSYHGATAAYHAAQVGTLTAQGYRPLSLSVAGDLAAPYVSASWIQRPGPTFAMSGPLDAAGFANWRLTQALLGRRPFLVTADGSGSNTVYMGVWLADSVPANLVLDVGKTQFDAECEAARGNGRWLTCAAMHGNSIVPRYSGVFEDNPDDVAWGHTINDTAAVLGQNKTAHQEGEARPCFVAGSSWGRYLSVWRDDRIGSWELVWDQPSASYQQAFNVYTGGGYFPLVVASHGPIASARYSAIFVQSDVTQPRSLTTTGLSVGALSSFDNHLQYLLQSEGARAGALAIVKDGRLVYARGYTRAEPGYHVTQPSDRFRLASLSKLVAAAATARIVQQGAPTYGTTVQSYLGYGVTTAGYQNITLDHLMQHASGLVRDGDPWAVANWWNPGAPTLPVDSVQTARWAAAQTLRFTPGMFYAYSNMAYITLGRFVESYSGTSFNTYAQNNVLQPLQITQAIVGGNSRSQLANNEVHYHLSRLDLEPSELHTDRRPMTPQYNRDMARMDSSGGMVMSAIDYVRLLAGVWDGGGDGAVVSSLTSARLNQVFTYPDYEAGGLKEISGGGMTHDLLANGVHAYSKGGTLEGVSTQAIYRSDGICIAAFVNKTYAHANLALLNSIADGVASWPSWDLFPTYGYPPYSFTCPAITNTVVGAVPNVTDSAFVFDGVRLDRVQSVALAQHTITSQSPSDWADGWFEIVNPTRIEVHPPQGLVPGAYPLVVSSSTCASAPSNVTVQLTPVALLRAADQPVGTFEAIASLGNHSLATFAFLTTSPDNQPTPIPGLVDLGIGNLGATLLVWPYAVSCDPMARVFRWQVPDLSGYPPMFFQAALIDLLAPSPFPLSTTDVELVTP